MSEQTQIDKITTEMAEHICDHLCRFPREMEQEELDEHCADCKIGQFICDIVISYWRSCRKQSRHWQIRGGCRL